MRKNEEKRRRDLARHLWRHDVAVRRKTAAEALWVGVDVADAVLACAQLDRILRGDKKGSARVSAARLVLSGASLCHALCEAGKKSRRSKERGKTCERQKPAYL